MSQGTDNILKSRKRVRQPQVDFNSSTIYRAPRKLRKASDIEMANNNSASNFIDMSSTINSRQAENARLAQGQGLENAVIGVAAGIDPEVRNLVVDETLSVQKALEERMKKMVQEEMADIKKMLGLLSTTVNNLANMNPQNAHANTVPEGVDNGMESANANFNRPYIPENNTMGQPPTTSRPSNLNNQNQTLQNNFEFYSPNGRLRATTDPVMITSGTSGVRSSEMQAVALQNGEHSQNFRSVEKMTIKVDKWGLVFNGNNTHLSVEDFIFRLEHLQSHYNVLWDEILRDFHLLVSGPAKDWYWLKVRTHGEMKWPTLRSELLSQYRTNISNFEIMRDLVERKQQMNESIDNFFFAMNKLRSRLVQPIPEYDMIKIMKRNVKESGGRIIYPIAVSSVEQLRLECNEAERNFPRRDLRNNVVPQRPNRMVSEVYVSEPEAYGGESLQETCEEVATSANNPQRRILKCWNCQRPGHGFRDCESVERKLFCYRCGKPNVVAPKCPDCNQENSRRGVRLTGDSRRTVQTPINQ